MNIQLKAWKYIIYFHWISWSNLLIITFVKGNDQCCVGIFLLKYTIKYIYDIFFFQLIFFKSMYLNEFHIQGYVKFLNILYS
jgi:hypothetical protein